MSRVACWYCWRSRFFFFSSRRRHTRCSRDWSSDVCFPIYADALVVHALAISVGFGLLFMLAVLGGGHWLYSAMGGSGASLTAALTYSNVLFAGAILIWVFNSLASVIRGTGNMAVPAVVTSVGAAALIPLSPCLIFGWGLFPRLRVARGAGPVVALYVARNGALGPYLRTRRPGGPPSLP